MNVKEATEEFGAVYVAKLDEDIQHQLFNCFYDEIEVDEDGYEYEASCPNDHKCVQCSGDSCDWWVKVCPHFAIESGMLSEGE